MPEQERREDRLKLPSWEGRGEPLGAGPGRVRSARNGYAGAPLGWDGAPLLLLLLPLSLQLRLASALVVVVTLRRLLSLEFHLSPWRNGRAARAAIPLNGVEIDATGAGCMLHEQTTLMFVCVCVCVCERESRRRRKSPNVRELCHPMGALDFIRPGARRNNNGDNNGTRGRASSATQGGPSWIASGAAAVRSEVHVIVRLDECCAVV